MSEADDDYFDRDPELQEISGSVLNDTVATLSPVDPICLPDTATVYEAVEQMVSRRQGGVLIVDREGRLIGVFTERDVLTRVLGRDADARRTRLGTVMTPNPEALSAGDRVAYAVHCMSVAGYRTVPLVDAERRPIGIVTVSEVIRWLANLFPETVLNLRPGDTMKRAGEIDMG